MSEAIRASDTLIPNRKGSIDPEQPPRSSAQRWFSLAELLVGSAIVIGHNVYHVVPNEVPILFALGLIRSGYATEAGARWDCAGRFRGGELF